MLDQSSRHLIIAKVNVITEAQKHTVLSETFSHSEMKLKYPLPVQFLNQKSPIIFQIVYSNEIRTYIFNVYGNASADSPMVVVFVPQSLNVIQQFINDVVLKKKSTAIE